MEAPSTTEFLATCLATARHATNISSFISNGFYENELALLIFQKPRQNFVTKFSEFLL